MIEVDETATLLDQIEFGSIGPWMLSRCMHHARPEHGDGQSQGAHRPEHVLPAEVVGNHAHHGIKQDDRKVLGRVEYGGGGATFRGGEPGRNDAAIGRKRRGLGRPEQEPQSVECPRREAGAAEETHEALEAGERRPEDDAPQVDEPGSESVEDPATWDLQRHIADREGREQEAKGDRIELQVPREVRADDRNCRPVGVVDGGDREQHQDDPPAGARRLWLVGGGGHDRGFLHLPLEGRQADGQGRRLRPLGGADDVAGIASRCG